MDRNHLNDYEQQAWDQIQAWKAAPPSRSAQAFGKAMKPVDKLMESRVVQRTVGKAVEGGVSAAMDAGNWSINSGRILSSYRNDGYEVHRLEDIPRVVPLEHIDKKVRALPLAYKGGMSAEGAGAGAVAFVGPWWAAGALAVDVVAVTVASCRSIAHVAGYYGFDTKMLHERHHAMMVLGVAGALSEGGKAAAIGEIARVSKLITQKKTWEVLEQQTLVATIRKLAAKFGADLTKKKLGQVVFGLGVFVGGGVNYWYAGEVSQAAYYSYRERFLEARGYAHEDADEVVDGTAEEAIPLVDAIEELSGRDPEH